LQGILLKNQSSVSIIMGKGGKGEKKATGVPAEKMEVIIDGRKYDVTDMKHPGGSVIKFYTNNGIDATQAFNNFHLRSKKAKKYLDNLSSVPVEDKVIKTRTTLPGQEALMKDFEEFTAQLKREVCMYGLCRNIC
jgi:fatty acid desaturase 2 (delta-6 desaturase)